MVGRAARLAFFLALAILHTWPLASAPHRLSLNHNADAQLNAWIVSWIAHVVPTDPTHFWQGNIFQPGEAALTFSEPLIVPAIIGAPILWMGGSAVLMFNLLLLAGLTASGYAAYRVLLRWTGSPGAALVAATLFTFNAHLLTRLPHLQAAHAWGLWLIWGATFELLHGRGRWWHLSVAVLLTAATSLHWLLFGIVGAAIMGVVAWPGVARLGRVAAAGAFGLFAALPTLWPHITNGVTRPLEQVADFSATPAGYVASLSHLHRGWSASWFVADTNVWFPGVVAMGLAGVGLAARWRDCVAVRWAVVMLVVGFVLSLGTATPVYAWLYHAFPPLQGIRAASRFGMLALTAIACLAGFGTAWVLSRWKQSRALVVVTTVLVAATAEQWLAPIQITPFGGVPSVYQLVRDEPGPVLLAEMPFYPPDAVFENGEYVLNATLHWRPLINGYSGVTPMSYRTRAESLWYFPEVRALDELARSGATHVMVHLERFGSDAATVADALQGHPDLRLLAADRDGHRLYRFIRE